MAGWVKKLGDGDGGCKKGRRLASPYGLDVAMTMTRWMRAKLRSAMSIIV